MKPVQQPVFRHPSETTTGGVYKWQGRNRHSLMSCAYETFLVARPIIAILGPNRVYVIPVVPRSFESSRTPCYGNLVLTDIVVRVSPRTLRSIMQNKESCREETNWMELLTAEAGQKIAVLWTILISTGQLGSRPLTESTKQITPPTKSGHAPPLKGSRKNTQSVNPHPLRIW